MICENDVKYLTRICEETGAPIDEVLKYQISTSCAEFAARHWDDANVMAKYNKFYERFTEKDADAMFETKVLLNDAKEKGIDFLDVAMMDQSLSYMGVVNRVLLMMHRESAENAQGRRSINDMKYQYEIKICLAEGNIDAYYILEGIEATARGKESGSVMHQGQAHILMLGLDDMGMRGAQIVYALDYYDGNMQALYDGIANRSGQMIAYVNKRAALEYDKDNSNPDFLAVTGGASSTHDNFGMTEQQFHLNIFNVMHFVAADVDPIKIDYSKMDIRDGVDMETGVKIAEAHGFEVMFKIPYQCMGDECAHIVMINRNTGDMLSANAQKDSMVYGGCRIIVPRRDGVKRAIFGGDIGVHGNCEEFDNSDWRAWECSHHEGCFAQYATVPRVSIDDIPWDKFPYRGMVSMPIPQPISEHMCWSFFNRMPDNLMFMFSSMHDEGYTVPMFANMLLAPKTIKENVPEEFQKYYCRMLDDSAKCFAESCYLQIYSARKFVNLFRMSAVIAELEDGDIAKYKGAIVNEAMKIQSRIEEQARLGHRRDNDIKDAQEFTKTLQGLDFRPDALDRYIVSKFYDKVTEPDVSALPQDVMNWMHQNAPDTYKSKDEWYLYGSMRDDYQLKFKDKTE